MTIAVTNFPFYPGVLTELNPLDLPLTTILMSRGVDLMPNKDYAYTFHTNPEQTAVTKNSKGDFSLPTYGSTGFTTGSNTMNVWDEGAIVTFGRQGDQALGRVLAWQDPTNASREEDPMARALKEAAERIMIYAEYNAREGAYNSLTNGGSGTWEQRGYRFAPGITNTAIGVAGGSAVGSLATITLTKLVDTLQTLWANKVNGSDELSFISNATPKRQVTDIFRDQFNAGKNGLERNFGGVAITSFMTDFGMVNTILTRNMPATEAYILNLSRMRAVANEVAGKGWFFDRVIPIAQSGEARSVYAQFGVDHGVGSCHARLYGIGAPGHLTTGTVASV